MCIQWSVGKVKWKLPIADLSQIPRRNINSFFVVLLYNVFALNSNEIFLNADMD